MMQIRHPGKSRRHRREIFLLLWLAAAASLAFCLDPQKDLRQYGHRSWQTDSGLPQNTVHAVVQSRDGYIWIATEGGLVRFDGVQFVVYDKQGPAHLRSTNINSLFEDSVGDLWIGTDDGLIRRRGAEFTSFTTSNGLPSNTLWSVFQDRAGTVWVVTPAGLGRYQDGHFQPFAVADGASDAKAVVEASDGSLWIGTRSGLAHWRRGDSPSKALEVAALRGVEVQTIAATPDGRVWAGTRTGLFSLTSGAEARPVSGLPSNEITAMTTSADGRLWIGTAKGAFVLANGANVPAVVGKGLPADRIEGFFEDSKRAMWIATSRGLARFFSDSVQSLSSREGLANDLVLSFFEDREGSLWLGTESGGLEMLHDQKFTSYTTADGLSDDLARAVIQDRNGAVWVGTNGGGVDRYDYGRFTSLTTANGLSSNIVLALGSDAQGDLWVGTPDGLNRIHNGHSTVFTSADGLADDFVRSLYAASDGSLWIGTRRGLSHLENGRFTSYSALDGLGSDLVGAIVADNREDHQSGAAQGSLWIGTLGGLSHFDRGKFTTVTTHDGLTSNVITALYQDHEGTLWIGTNQGGLNRMRGGKVVAYPPDQTHLPENIYAILEDGGGNLWLSSKTGIYRVSGKDLNDFADRKLPSLAVSSYGTSDGMKISECSSGGHPAAWKLADGEMWFATLKGMAAIDPERLTRNTEPPPVAIEEVLVDDQIVDVPGTLVVPPGRSRFEFHYAGLSFIAPQKVRFQYKLDGFDRNWVDAGTRRTAYYTNLSPGKYRFHVLAANNDDVWNQTGASLEMRLRPRFSQTYWFFSLLLLSLALLSYLVYRWRVRQVELRFTAVLSERGRIAREIHDTLAQGLVAISVQLELVNRLLSPKSAATRESAVEDAKAHLDQTRNLVRDSLAEARSSIWDLRSQAAETEDLATRLSRMASAIADNSDPKIQIKSRVLGAYRPGAPRTESELLRIAQEAVTNAVRHAKPTRISIELRFAARELQMTIQDDGCGFDGNPHPQSSGPGGHFGLTGMRERAKQIGGTLTIESAPGKGTQVCVQVSIDG